MCVWQVSSQQELLNTDTHCDSPSCSIMFTWDSGGGNLAFSKAARPHTQWDIYLVKLPLCLCVWVFFQGNCGSLNFHTHTGKGFPTPTVTVTCSHVPLLAAWRFEWCNINDLTLQVFKPARTHDSLACGSIYCVCSCTVSAGAVMQ